MTAQSGATAGVRPDVDERAAVLAAGLVAAEDRLRARGLTGASAFAALRDGLLARLGEGEASEAARDAVRELPLDGGADLLGLAYERFFTDLFKGRRGQYFTPRPLVELLLDRAGVGPGDRVLDPTCGSGGILVAAARRGAGVQGIELDPLLVDLARLNLRLAGVDGAVSHADFFAAEPEPVDVVLANPPFSVAIRDRAVLDRYALGRGRPQVPSDWLFVEALERWVRPGGRAGVVLPWSILVNPSLAPARERLAAHWQVEAVCGLPEGVFRPFGGAAGRAALLWLRRGARGPTRWAELVDPGYDVRSIHYRPTGGADLARLADPEAWIELPEGAWTPARQGTAGPALSGFASARQARVRPDGPCGLVELADADKATGELSRVRQVEGVEGARPVLQPGDLLISRLRPELGNVAVARRPADLRGPLVGSPEWIVLRPERAPHYLLHALRTPTWRRALPVTGGQTRPRTTPEQVLDSPVPWPGDALAGRIDRVSRTIHEERARLREALDGLQAAVDGWADGGLDDEALSDEVRALELLLGVPDDDGGAPR